MDREFSGFQATDDNTIKKKKRKFDILKGREFYCHLVISSPWAQTKTKQPCPQGPFSSFLKE